MDHEPTSGVRINTAFGLTFEHPCDGPPFPPGSTHTGATKAIPELAGPEVFVAFDATSSQPLVLDFIPNNESLPISIATSYMRTAPKEAVSVLHRSFASNRLSDLLGLTMRLASLDGYVYLMMTNNCANQPFRMAVPSTFAGSGYRLDVHELGTITVIDGFWSI